MRNSSFNSGVLHAACRVIVRIFLHIMIRTAYDSWKDHWK